MKSMQGVYDIDVVDGLGAFRQLQADAVKYGYSLTRAEAAPGTLEKSVGVFVDNVVAPLTLPRLQTIGGLPCSEAREIPAGILRVWHDANFETRPS